jgi:hypothetical protein
MSEFGVFSDLTVVENIRLGGYFLDAAEVKRRSQRLFAMFPDLAERRGTKASRKSSLLADLRDRAIDSARLRAGAVRETFTVEDFHLMLPAGLPAHPCSFLFYSKEFGLSHSVAPDRRHPSANGFKVKAIARAASSPAAP